MDPVSSIGLASSVLTFIQFAWDLIGGAVEIYRSVDGKVAHNAQLDDVRDDLDYLSDLLDQRPPCVTRVERRIARIAEDCRADSRTLQNSLREIAGHSSNKAIWRSLNASWMNVRRRKDVADMKIRLQDYRSEVLLQVTLLLSEEQSSLNLRIAKLRDECSQLRIGFLTQITSTRNKILEAIENLNQSNGGAQATTDTSLSDMSKMLLAIEAQVDETQIQHQILSQLAFEDMNSRAYQIPKAAHDTYNWTLEDETFDQFRPCARARAGKAFVEWLRVGDKILHISGNPGSGKSILMKFLSRHERTMQELQAWAAPNALIFCTFYFWNPGSKMQRTVIGLYRSLLFQALSQCPGLTKDVFPIQFRRLKASFGDRAVKNIQYFDEASVEEGFTLLLNQASIGGYRMCFFIDGLDECEGNRLQHEDLANMLQAWVATGTIKICVSSRPYSEFIHSLNLTGTRPIQLHEFNRVDITVYCLNRLRNDIYAQKRRSLCDRLIDIVVDHAQGVFLWVHLVIDVLLVGFRQGDPDSVLETQLHALPSDLDMLYTKLREPIEADRIQKARANRMLLLAAHNPFRRDLTAMAFAWLEGQEGDEGGLASPDFPPADQSKRYSDEEITERLAHVMKQVDGLARGFLEIQEAKYDLTSLEHELYFFTYKVGFCHRTARDYLLDNEDRRRALLDSFPNFEESQPYAKICLAEIIHGWHEKTYHGLDFFDHYFTKPQTFSQTVDADLIARFETPLRGILTATELNLTSRAGGPLMSRYDQVSQASFVEYAAFCGLDRFVLREVGREAARHDGTSTGSSILLAAVAGEHYKLASTLMSQGMNEICVVCDVPCETAIDPLPTINLHKAADVSSVINVHKDTGVYSLVPAIVIATLCVFNRLVFYLNETHIRLAQMEMVKKLLGFNLGLNISMWATIYGVCVSREHGHLSDESEHLRVRINVADSIMLFGDRTDLVADHGTGSKDSWATNMAAKLISCCDVRVEGAGPDVLQSLKQWLYELHPAFGHGTYGDDRLLVLSNMEWASDSQELVELKGRTRFY